MILPKIIARVKGENVQEKHLLDLEGVHIQSCHKSYIDKINLVIVILEKFVTFIFFCR